MRKKVKARASRVSYPINDFPLLQLMTTLPHDHLPLSDNTQHSSPAPSHPYQPEKLGSRKRYPTEPNRPLNPFPSPPLSAPTHEDPWRPMSEPPSTRGYTWQVEDMEGSWRKEVAGKGKEVLWDANDHEPVPGLGELPNPRQRIERERDSLERDLLARGPLPIAVWAKVMDSSKGRDKVLVGLVSPLFTGDGGVRLKLIRLEMRSVFFENVSLPPATDIGGTTVITLV